MIKLKRAYEPVTRSDGKRILVERLWPRGLTKDRAQIDVWLKEVSPSPALRKWYAHDPAKWREFQKRYWLELKRNHDGVERLKREVRGKTVTFVYAAREETRNSALVLKRFLNRK